MSSSSTFLSVTGIRSAGGSIGPKGNHLRWSFPADRGFPRAFLVFRRKAETKPADVESIDLAALARHPARPQHGLTLVVDGHDPSRTRLQCAEPLVFLACTLTGQPPVEMRAFDGEQLVERRMTAQSPGGERFHFPGITRVELDLPFQRISSLTLQTQRTALDADGWQRVTSLEILPPTRRVEALDRLRDVQNHYAASEDEARRKYGRQIDDLLRWQARVTDVSRPLDVVEHGASTSGDRSERGARLPVLSSLLLAALDPNIARILSLYWEDDEEGQFDYKVRGIWNEPARVMVEGLALSVGGAPTPAPPNLPTPIAEDMRRRCWQLPGISWRQHRPLGRMALRWFEPSRPVHAAGHAIQPVVYDVVRTTDRRRLTADRLALISRTARADPGHPWLIDPAAPIGAVSYAVSGIDIFGRRGGATTLFGDVREAVAPPAPIRLRCELDESQSHLTGSFEFGAMQLMQTPDVTDFELMWRPDSPVHRVPARLEVVTSDENEDGTVFHHAVRVRAADGRLLLVGELQVFEGGVVETPRGDAGHRVPASERYTWRIVSIDPSGVMHLTSSNVHSPAGHRELVADVHHRGNWISLTPDEPEALQAWPPLSGTITAIHTLVTARVTAVADVPTPTTPTFDLIPANRRSTTAPPSEPVLSVQDLTIDRVILDPSPWLPHGRVVSVDRIEDAEILAILPPRTDGSGSIIRIEAGRRYADGDRLVLHPTAASGPATVAALRIAPAASGPSADWLAGGAGELSCEAVVDGEATLGLARLIARPTRDGAEISVIVGAPTAASDLLQVNRTVRYFRANHFSLFVTDSAGANGTIALPFEANDATRSGFLAVCARRGQPPRSGPLCAPVAFTAVRVPPHVTPPVPYPAGDRHAPEGFATPPDAGGRSMIRVEWDRPAMAGAFRYEVARALDVAIPIAHRRNWLRGGANEYGHSVRAGVAISGSLAAVERDDSGIYKATFTPTGTSTVAADFRGGRLKQTVIRTSGGSRVTDVHYFEITFAARRATDGALRLLLRPVGQAEPIAGISEIKTAPDYALALADAQSLRALAADNPEAFALATGSPVAETTFLDEVAGSGRFFYRVRAIDPAGNRTPWSGASVAFTRADER